MATGDPGLDLQQVQQGLSQVQGLLTQLQVTIQGDPAQGVLSYNQVLDFVKEAAPKLNPLVSGLDAVTQRVANVESTIEPVLQAAQGEINKLATQSQNIQTVIDREVANLKQESAKTQEACAGELQTQNTKHDSLIQHAQAKFQELESNQQALVDAAKVKFDELDALRTNFELQVADKVREMDQKMAQATRLINDAASTGGQGGGSVPYRVRGISEFKAIQFLEKYSGETRVGYKTWTRKLKNALDEARGCEWRAALEGIENYRVSTDFEELTSTDDQWDEYFETHFGYRRRDSRPLLTLISSKEISHGS